MRIEKSNYMTTKYYKDIDEKINTEEILKVIPLGKLGSCTQIANLVSFLVSSDAGSYITGQTISIDGGMSI